MGKCPTFYRKGELAPKSLANTLYFVCLCVFISIFRQPQTMLSASVNAFHLRKTAFRWFFRSCGAISQAISTNHPAIGHSPAPAICKKSLERLERPLGSGGEAAPPLWFSPCRRQSNGAPIGYRGRPRRYRWRQSGCPHRPQSAHLSSRAVRPKRAGSAL